MRCQMVLFLKLCGRNALSRLCQPSRHRSLDSSSISSIADLRLSNFSTESSRYSFIPSFSIHREIWGFGIIRLHGGKGYGGYDHASAPLAGGTGNGMYGVRQLVQVLKKAPAASCAAQDYMGMVKLPSYHHREIQVSHQQCRDRHP